MGLKPLLPFFWHAGEFDPHSDSRGRGCERWRWRAAFLLRSRNRRAERSYIQRHYRLDIATIPADVGGVHAQGRINALITQFERESNLVAGRFWRLSCRCAVCAFHFHVVWKNRGPPGIPDRRPTGTPIWVFFSAPASTTHMTLQRAFLPSYCTPMTSPTFSSGSMPKIHAPVALIFCAVAFWKKGWPLHPFPTRGLSSPKSHVALTLGPT